MGTVKGIWKTCPAVVTAALACLAAAGAALAGAVEAWELPQGAAGVPGDRREWKPAVKGAAPAGGLALDSGNVLVLARPGAEGADVFPKLSNGETASGAHLVLTDNAGRTGRIQRVDLSEADPETATMTLTTEQGTLAVTVQAGGHAAQVRSVSNGTVRLDVRGLWRYAIVPDLDTTQDAIYDPTRFAGETASVAADNFLFALQDGGQVGLMCTWPGVLAKAGKEDSKTAPAVALLAGGQGTERRWTALRFEFRSGPLHFGPVAAEGLWHDRDVAGLKPKTQEKLAWTCPFKAQWKAAFLAADSRGAQAASRCYVFLEEPKAGYPVWLKGGEAWLAVPAEAGSARADRLLLYAIDRHKETPLALFTPTDILRETLGVDPCQYVLDLKEMKVRAAGAAEAPTPRIEGVPPDSPEQAKLRAELKGKGYIYLPRGNQVWRVNADGTDLRRLMAVERKRSIPSCQASWDGRDVAVVVYPPWGQKTHEVRLIDPEGKNTRTVHSSENRPSVAWTPDSAWLVVIDGTKVKAVKTATGEAKEIMEVALTREVKDGSPMGCLSSDRHGSFYFWGDYVRGGNAFTVDKDCSLIRGLFNSGMVQTCQPRVSPDGTKMARHDHDYEWLGGNKRGYVSEKPEAGADRFKRRYFFPKNEDMPMKGWMDAPFWSPDGAYLAFVYKPDIETLKNAGFQAEKGYSVIAITRSTGGPMVWLAPGGASLFPSWGPVPEGAGQVNP